jgi:hypothetical protein
MGQAMKKLEQLRIEIVASYETKLLDDDRRTEFLRAMHIIQVAMNSVTEDSSDESTRPWIYACRATADCHEMVLQNKELMKEVLEEAERGDKLS